MSMPQLQVPYPDPSRQHVQNLDLRRQHVSDPDPKYCIVNQVGIKKQWKRNKKSEEVTESCQAIEIERKRKKKEKLKGREGT